MRAELEESVEGIRKLTRNLQHKEEEMEDLRRRQRLADETAENALVGFELLPGNLGSIRERVGGKVIGVVCHRTAPGPRRTKLWLQICGC